MRYIKKPRAIAPSIRAEREIWASFMGRVVPDYLHSYKRLKSANKRLTPPAFKNSPIRQTRSTYFAQTMKYSLN